MSIGDRYRHTLSVRRAVASGATDDYGQPVTAETVVASVPGLVQPRKGREVTYTTQAGPAIADFYGYCDPLASLDTDCWLVVDGVRYDVLHVADSAGLGHHYELDLRRVD